MTSITFLSHFVLVQILEACIPTQQIEAIERAHRAEEAALAQEALIEAQIKAAEIYALTHTTTVTSIITTTTTTTEITTTTTLATTTTTTVYPCSVCTPIYDATCQGVDMPSSSMYCLTADEVPVTYTLGPVASPSLPADTCSTRLACPSGTVARFNVPYTGYIDGNSDGSPTLTYCSESLGSWEADINGSPNSVSDIACQYP
uniref:CUB domain-containing protein n=1 Tax=Caenorhabditis tropicalis TaxID=1561998 RepID=A0A1I7U8N7_9PELO